MLFNMKSIALFSLLASLGAQAAPLEPRQLSGLLSQILDEAVPNRTVELPTTMKRDGAKRVRLYYGPFELLGAQAAKAVKNPMKADPGSSVFARVAKGLPTESTVLKTNTSIQFMDGTLADVGAGIYNHHVVLFDMSKTSPIVTTCPNQSFMMTALLKATSSLTFLGGTSEDTFNMLYSTADGMFNSGFWLPKTDKLMILGDLINYKNESQHIFSVTDIEYIPGKVPNMLDTYNTIFEISSCGGEDAKKMTSPKGLTKFNAISKPMKINQDGWLLHKTGHLHDGGDAVVMTLNGKVVCESKAQYGGGSQVMKTNDGKVWETLSSMGECDDPVKVKAGDMVEIEARYDFEAHPARKHAVEDGGMGEVMGLMTVGFATDPKGTGGMV